MSDVKKWSEVAASNSQAAPDGWPEGMLRSDVNNAAREVMRAVRQFYGDPTWQNSYDTQGDRWLPQKQTDTSVRLAPQDAQVTDISSRFPAGSRFRLFPTGGPSYLYGFVVSASFSTPNTLVEVDFDLVASVVPATITSFEIIVARDALAKTAFYPPGVTLAQTPPMVPTIDDLGSGATVDMGSGNGFDADTVDGFHASQLIASAGGGGINVVYNGEFQVWQRGLTIDNDTTLTRIYTNNHANYNADRWKLFSGNSTSDINNVVTVARDLTTPPTGYWSSLKMTGVTVAANTMAGIFQILEARDAAVLIGASAISMGVEFKGSAALDKVRFMVLGWTGTADDPTLGTDPITDWGTPGSGGGPTLTASWTKLLDSGQQTISTSWARVVKENVDISAVPGVKNLGILIYIDDPSWAAADTLNITGVRLENGSVAGAFTHINQAHELIRCQRYFNSTFSEEEDARRTAGIAQSIVGYAGSATTEQSFFQWDFPVTMFKAPTITAWNPTNDVASEVWDQRNNANYALSAFTASITQKAAKYTGLGVLTASNTVLVTGLTANAEF